MRPDSPRCSTGRSILGVPSRWWGSALLVLALPGAPAPVVAQSAYPGFPGEPPHLDVSCVCNPETPPSGTYGMSTPQPQGGMTEPEPVTVEAVDCGRVLEIDTGPTTLTLTRGQRGEVTVYEGDYEDREGMMARLTLVVVETDGLAFEPAVVVRMRGEAVPWGNPEFRVPITLTLQRLSPEAARACECALMGRYYERIMQYREIFADDALMEEARSRDLGLQDFKVFVNDVRMERRAAFDASLGRTAADEIPGGGGSTNPEGAIHVDDLAMLERGVPPALIESVHVHEEVHQAERLGGTALTTREILAQEEVAASEAQLAFIEGWLQEHCPRWEAPTRVF